MKKKKLTAGESVLEGAKQALAFARGEKNGCVVHGELKANLAVQPRKCSSGSTPFMPAPKKAAIMPIRLNKN
jgi:hypothetical protein